jgi:hypothetical protein
VSQEGFEPSTNGLKDQSTKTSGLNNRLCFPNIFLYIIAYTKITNYPDFTFSSDVSIEWQSANMAVRLFICFHL